VVSVAAQHHPEAGGRPGRPHGKRGDLDKGRQIHDRYFELFKNLFIETNPDPPSRPRSGRWGCTTGRCGCRCATCRPANEEKLEKDAQRPARSSEGAPSLHRVQFLPQFFGAASGPRSPGRTRGPWGNTDTEGLPVGGRPGADPAIRPEAGRSGARNPDDRGDRSSPRPTDARRIPFASMSRRSGLLIERALAPGLGGLPRSRP